MSNNIDPRHQQQQQQAVSWYFPPDTSAHAHGGNRALSPHGNMPIVTPTVSSQIVKEAEQSYATSQSQMAPDQLQSIVLHVAPAQHRGMQLPIAAEEAGAVAASAPGQRATSQMDGDYPLVRRTYFDAIREARSVEEAAATGAGAEAGAASHLQQLDQHTRSSSDLSASMDHQSQTFEQQDQDKKPIARKACENCRKAHSCCSDFRPCKRCTTLGLQCTDAPPKKRGRKRKAEREEIEREMRRQFDLDAQMDGDSSVDASPQFTANASAPTPPPPQQQVPSILMHIHEPMRLETAALPSRMAADVSANARQEQSQVSFQSRPAKHIPTAAEWSQSSQENPYKKARVEQQEIVSSPASAQPSSQYQSTPASTSSAPIYVPVAQRSWEPSAVKGTYYQTAEQAQLDAQPSDVVQSQSTIVGHVSVTRLPDGTLQCFVPSDVRVVLTAPILQTLQARHQHAFVQQQQLQQQPQQKQQLLQQQQQQQQQQPHLPQLLPAPRQQQFMGMAPAYHPIMHHIPQSVPAQQMMTRQVYQPMLQQQQALQQQYAQSFVSPTQTQSMMSMQQPNTMQQMHQNQR